MYQLIDLVCEALRQNKTVALAVVVHQQGSAPRGAGSRLLADGTGLMAGTIGGGLVESRVLDACRKALLTGEATVLDFKLTGELAAKSEMICGGAVRVFLEPITPRELIFFEKLQELLKKGCVLVTDVHSKDNLRHSLISMGEFFGKRLPEEVEKKSLALAEHREKEPQLQTIAGEEYLLEYIPPPLRMIIAGGGHVSRPTAQVAAIAGFSVTVIDDREEFSTPERFPFAESVRTVPHYNNCFADLIPDDYTYIVIVTRGHLHDASVLQQALQTKAGYIGMIGSKRKREEVYTALRQQRVSEEAIESVHCPIGLPIKAETPEEIAVSIVAECLAHRRGAL